MIAEKELLDDNNKVSKALDMYKARVERLDSSISVLKEENDALKAQLNGSTHQTRIDELHKKFEDHLKMQAQAMLAQFASGKMIPAGMTVSAPSASREEPTAEELEAARKAKEDEDTRRKEEMEKNKEEQRNKYTDKIDELKKDAKEKDEKIRAIEEELNQLRAEKAKTAELEEQLLSQREGDIGEISGARYNSLLGRYKSVTEEKINLTSRVTSLEEELKQYNQYMRDSAMMYRRDRAVLRDAIKKHLTTIAENKDTIEGLQQEINKLNEQVAMNGGVNFRQQEDSDGHDSGGSKFNGDAPSDAAIDTVGPDTKSEDISEDGDSKEILSAEDIAPELTNSLDNLNGPASARKGSKESAQALIDATFEAGSPRSSEATGGGDPDIGTKQHSTADVADVNDNNSSELQQEQEN